MCGGIQRDGVEKGRKRQRDVLRHTQHMQGVQAISHTRGYTGIKNRVMEIYATSRDTFRFGMTFLQGIGVAIAEQL